MARIGTYLFVDAKCPLEAFQGIAYSMLLHPEGHGTGTRGVDYCERWSNKDTVIEWQEVGKLDCSFVWFISPDPKFTSEYLIEGLDAMQLSEFLSLACEPGIGHDNLVDILFRVAYMSPELIADVLALFERTLQDPRPTIRLAALNAYMIRRWPPLWERVVNIEANDPDEEVRAKARQVINLGPAT